MQQLVDKIGRDANYLGNGIIKMDSFLNHQVDVALAEKMAKAFCARFSALPSVTKVITVETSGIPVAVFVARQLDVPMLFARKSKSLLMQENYYTAETVSRTRQTKTGLYISSEYLTENDDVLFIDDFLATGQSSLALMDIIKQSGAKVHGLGYIIEKPQEGGREKLAQFGVQVEALAAVTWEGDELKVSIGKGSN